MISSPNNATIRRLRRLRKAKERARQKAFIVEGYRALAVALSSGARVDLVLHTPDAAKRHRQLLIDAADAGVRLLEVGERVTRALSSAANPPDVLAVAPIPRPSPSGPSVIANKIKDPATLGSVLASAASAGYGKAVLVRGTTDAYASTVVRTAAGAHFAMAITSADTVEAALGDDPAVYLSDQGPSPWAKEVLSGTLVIGDDPLTGVHVAVPDNAAGVAAPLVARAAIVMFEARRQREGER